MTPAFPWASYRMPDDDPPLPSLRSGQALTQEGSPCQTFRREPNRVAIYQVGFS